MASAPLGIIASVYHWIIAALCMLLVLLLAYNVGRLVIQGALIYAGLVLLLALSMAALGMSHISKARNPVSQNAGVHLLAAMLQALGVEILDDISKP